MSEHVNPKRAWLIAILLALFMLVNFIDKIAIGMVAVPMMADLGLSPTEFGVVASSFFWLFSISGVVGGFIANRVSARWLLLAMAVVWSAVQLPVIVSSSLMVIIFARVLLGIAEGPSWPIAVHACYKWFPNDKRNLPVSVIGQGATVGLLFAGFIMPMVTAHWGWRANFVGLCLVGIAWTVLWLVLGAEGPLGNTPKASDAAAKSSSHRVSYARLLTDTTILSNFVLHFVAYWGLALTLTWLPAFLQKGLQYDAVTAGRLFALVVVVGTPINVGLSWWSQRLLANGASSRTARAQFSSAFLILAGLLFGALLVIDLNPLAKVLVVAVATG